MLKYAYEAESESVQRKKRILPDMVENEGWVEHELPEDAQTIYNQICIIQTGIGNEAREIRVSAMNQEGIVGFFRKTSLAQDSKWEFVPNNQIDISQPLRKERNSVMNPFQQFLTMKEIA